MSGTSEERCSHASCGHPRSYHECDGAPGSCAASDHGDHVCDCLSFLPSLLTFGPRTEAWILRAVDDYERWLRRTLRERGDPTEFTGGD